MRPSALGIETTWSLPPNPRLSPMTRHGAGPGPEPLGPYASSLYAHVNGRWLASHEIPADRAMDGSFALHDQAEEQVRDIIADAGAAAAEGRSTDPVEAKVGAVYASFMDIDAIAAAGTAPLRTDLALLESATTQAELRSGAGRPAAHRGGRR